MFERFSDRARRVTALAREEALTLNHNYIGTEHILLGLLREGEGAAAKALQALGVSVEAARQQVEEIIGPGDHAPPGRIPPTSLAEKVLELPLKALESLGISMDAVRQQAREFIGAGGQAPPGHIPFTPRAKKVLELSVRESVRLGDNHIGTGHILLGLIRESGGDAENVAVRVLVRLGADPDLVRQQVIQLLHDGDGDGDGEGEASQGAAEPGAAVREGWRGEVLGALDSIAERLDAIERRLGMAGPPAGRDDNPS